MDDASYRNGVSVKVCRYSAIFPGEPCRNAAVANNPFAPDLLLCNRHIGLIARQAPKKYTTKTVTKTRRRTVHTSEENNLRIDIKIRNEKIASLKRDIALLEAQVNALTESKKPSRKIDLEAPGIVYFLRSGGYYKIGWTADLAGRMKSYAPDTLLLATFNGTRRDEKRLQKRFAHVKTHGREWFAMTADLTRFIEQVVTEHGAPAPVDFGAKPVSIPMPHRLNTIAGPKPKGWPA